MVLGADYLVRFLNHPTWPGAIVITAAIIALAWIVVTTIKEVFRGL